MTCPAELRPYLPDFAHHLCDLSAYADEELRGEAVLRAGLLALKHVFAPDVGRRLPEILGLFRDVARSLTGLAALEAVLRSWTSATDAIDEPTLRRALDEALPALGETIMPTLMEQWTKRAHQQGIQQGQTEGEAAILVRQLERRFGPLSPRHRARIESADAETLLVWGDRVLTAQSVDEVFGH